MLIEVVSDLTAPPDGLRGRGRDDRQLGQPDTATRGDVVSLSVDGQVNEAELLYIQDWWGLTWEGVEVSCIVVGRGGDPGPLDLISNHKLGCYLTSRCTSS